MGPVAYTSLCLLGCLMLGPSLARAQGAGCPAGWTPHNGNCYGYFPRRMAWRQAEGQCQSFGAKSHLASIHSPEEQRVIADLIARAHGYDDEVWIGLHIAGRSDNWVWVDGSPTVHEAWHKYRRHYSRKGENCAALEDDSGYMTWDKDSCYDRNAFVCKLTL
ncbi:struthiocalcin-2-like [Alligator mississippiensis]|uniref:struthiocalcin-2-like n=1 Tax=Alligator mississippiensis TaxID=8496 RepID=UPI002877FD5B|nr:struthiocalcin-2-like [Alligator mississippiensis]